MKPEFKKDIKGYEVKGVIDEIGHDLAGFKATLYYDNKKVAVVYDDGYGAGYEYSWIDKNHEPEFNKFIESEHKLREKEFQPKDDLEKEVGFIFDKDIFVSELVDKYHKLKELRGFCRKGIHFQVGDMIGSDVYKYVKTKYSGNETKFEEYLKKKYPNEKVMILNKEMGIN